MSACNRREWARCGKRWRVAAQRLGLSVVGVSVEEPSPAEYRRLSAALAEQTPDAMVVITFGFDAGIVELAAKQQLPAIYSSRAYVDIGGLMAYGPDSAEIADSVPMKYTRS